jgi:hypothetical protein
MLKKKYFFFRFLTKIKKNVYFCTKLIKPKQKPKMKKVLSIVAVAALSAAFVSCGPSKEELAAKQKQTEDSLAAVAQQQADSLAKVAEAEAAAAAEAAAKMAADSTRMADSVAAATKGGKKH